MLCWSNQTDFNSVLCRWFGTLNLKNVFSLNYFTALFCGVIYNEHTKGKGRKKMHRAWWEKITCPEITLVHIGSEELLSNLAELNSEKKRKGNKKANKLQRIILRFVNLVLVPLPAGIESSSQTASQELLIPNDVRKTSFCKILIDISVQKHFFFCNTAYVRLTLRLY